MTEPERTGKRPETPRLDHRLGLMLNRVAMRPFLPRPRLLLVLGAMRSGSSLLTNILTSNPGIAGFGESHVVYDHPDRLLDLRYWVFRYTRRYPGPRQFLLDKILHGEYTPDLAALCKASRPHVVVLLRAPSETGPSLETMYATLRRTRGRKIDVWPILGQRYRDLDRQVQEIPADVPLAALSYEALLETPERTLEGLGRFLDLATPLSPAYDVPRWSGTWGLGDGSAMIRSGRIEPRPRPDNPVAGVPPDVAAAYHALTARLAARADPALL